LISKIKDIKYKKKNVNINPYLSIFKNLRKIKKITNSRNSLATIPPILKIRNSELDLFSVWLNARSEAVTFKAFITPA
jgi:hypothetical protein